MSAASPGGRPARRLADRLVPPLERDARRLLRDALRMGLALLVAPNLAVRLAALPLADARPALNLDYLLPVLTFPWLGAIGAAAVAGMVALLELLVAIAHHFRGNPTALITAAPDALMLPLSRTLPIAAGLLLFAAAVFAVAYALLRRMPRRSGPNVLVLATAVAGLWLAGAAPERRPAEPARAVVFDDLLLGSVLPVLALATEHRGVGDTPVESASGALFERLDAGAPLPPRVVVVLVEALGRLLEERADSMQLGGFDDPRLSLRYDVRRGSVPFAGLTVNGELRELCGRSSESVRPLPELLPTDACLPGRLRQRGYRSVALHGFREMFDRRTWWPALGFDEVMLEGELGRELRTAERCGDLYPGLCDQDVAEYLERRLLTDEDPTFFYWVTLDAHFPISEDVPPEADAPCERTSFARHGGARCRLLRLHEHLTQRLARLALHEELGPTAFVIVGDHAPVLSPGARALLDPERVPYVVLWPKRPPPAMTTGR